MNRKTYTTDIYGPRREDFPSSISVNDTSNRVKSVCVSNHCLLNQAVKVIQGEAAQKRTTNSDCYEKKVSDGPSSCPTLRGR